MNDIMADLETLGRTPGCAILSIGAVAFDRATGELGEKFYCVINTKSCLGLGLHVNADTLAWWKKQTPEAREVIKLASLKKSSLDLTNALVDFKSFCYKQGAPSAIKIWGNGADFDNAILACAYAACSMVYPIQYWNNRCHRTFKNEAPEIKVPRTGIYHNALADAISQVGQHALVWQKLYGKKKIAAVRKIV